MTTEPSKLHRKLGAAGMLNPSTGRLLQLNVGAVGYNDHDIVSIKIIHGTDSAEPGVDVARAEIRLKGKLPIVNGQVVDLYLTSTAFNIPDRLSAQWRFRGRVTTQAYYDHPRTPTTVIQASSWMALALASSIQETVGAGWGHYDIIADISTTLYDIDPENFSWVAPTWIDNTDRAHASESNMTFRSRLQKYIADTGIYTVLWRNGQLTYYDPAKMRENLENTTNFNGTPFVRPLEYHHLSAPMDLHQTVENPHVGVLLTRRDSVGNVTSGVWSFGQNWEETGVAPSTYVEVDWTHMRYTDNSLYRWALNALAHRLFRVMWYTTEARMDILRLATSSNSRDVDAARGALTVNVGDWLPFGRDWTDDYRGPKCITGWTETITPDQWTIDFNIHAPQQITGRYGVDADPEPVFPSYPWERYDRTTESYPGTMTHMLAGTYTWQYDDVGD